MTGPWSEQRMPTHVLSHSPCESYPLFHLPRRVVHHSGIMVSYENIAPNVKLPPSLNEQRRDPPLDHSLQATPLPAQALMLP